MHEWLQAVQDSFTRGEPCVLLTVLEARGSVPRPPGTKMVVTPSGENGSIGGGRIEYQAVQFGRQLLSEGADAAICTRRLPQAGSTPPETARSLTILFEPLIEVRFDIWLFGAGHVAKALLPIVAALPCRISWVDSRAALFPTELPINVTAIPAALPDSVVPQASADGYFLLMSHSHEQDFRIAEAVIERDDAAFLGMVGSARKRTQLVQRLVASGAARARLAQSLVCPLGLPELKGRLPAEIAIAIAAQVLLARQRLQQQPLGGKRADIC